MKALKLQEVSPDHPEGKNNEEGLEPEDDVVELVHLGLHVPHHLHAGEEEGYCKNTAKNKKTFLPEKNWKIVRTEILELIH